MNLLAEHFERVARVQGQGLEITPGVYIDVGGTLVRGLNKPYLPVVDFAKWNAGKKSMGDNHVFSSDVADAQQLMNDGKIALADIGVAEIIPKERTYNEAFSRQHTENIALIKTLSEAAKKEFQVRSSHCLELVIDDRPPPKQGLKQTDLFITWWDPYDETVKRFLEEKAYLNFTP